MSKGRTWPFRIIISFNIIKVFPGLVQNSLIGRSEQALFLFNRKVTLIIIAEELYGEDIFLNKLQFSGGILYNHCLPSALIRK